MKPLKRNLLIACGILCILLGLIGIILPVLPTTPFLLLAAYCFARSSERFHTWLVTNGLFGQYIQNFQDGRGIPRRTKALAITMLWLIIGISAVFFVSSWWLRVALVAVAIGVTIHLVRRKTVESGANPVVALADCEEL